MVCRSIHVSFVTLKRPSQSNSYKLLLYKYETIYVSSCQTMSRNSMLGVGTIRNETKPKIYLMEWNPFNNQCIVFIRFHWNMKMACIVSSSGGLTLKLGTNLLLPFCGSDFPPNSLFSLYILFSGDFFCRFSHQILSAYF